MRFSIIIPVYNERPFLEELLDGVRAYAPGAQIIAVDDGSTDGSGDLLESLAGGDLQVVRYAENRGKGYAVRKGLGKVRGDVVVIQDADLEYSPQDLPLLTAEFDDPGVWAVYGTRHPEKIGAGAGSLRSRLNSAYRLRSNVTLPYLLSLPVLAVGSAAITQLTNLLYGSQLTDVTTGYKLIRTKLLRELPLRYDGFEFCVELTAHLLARRVPIRELPIRYTPRTYSLGKKLYWHHGLRAAAALLSLYSDSAKPFREPYLPED